MASVNVQHVFPHLARGKALRAYTKIARGEAPGTGHARVRGLKGRYNTWDAATHELWLPRAWENYDRYSSYSVDTEARTMDHFSRQFTRRNFLAGLATGAVSLASYKIFAEERARFIEAGDYADELVRTPWQTEGPFFPDKLPLDVDNDLVVISSRSTPAMGEVTHLTGKILDTKGNPIKGATIEIWQVDVNGAYIHTGSDNREKLDKNFQGYGKFLTDSTGEYRFRTIKPVAYPGRPPHIHVKVRKGERELLTTQCYVKGDPRNDRDGIIRDIRDARARASLIVPFEPVKGSKVRELSAKFDIVLGLTSAD